MSLSVHPFVQYANNFDAMTIGDAKENYMTTLREFFVTLSNSVSCSCNLGSVGEASERVKQLTDIGVALCLSPALQGVLCNFSQVSIGYCRQSESSHQC